MLIYESLIYAHPLFEMGDVSRVQIARIMFQYGVGVSQVFSANLCEKYVRDVWCHLHNFMAIIKIFCE